jgi:hypothetical protein
MPQGRFDVRIKKKLQKSLMRKRTTVSRWKSVILLTRLPGLSERNTMDSKVYARGMCTLEGISRIFASKQGRAVAVRVIRPCNTATGTLPSRAHQSTHGRFSFYTDVNTIRNFSAH